MTTLVDLPLELLCMICDHLIPTHEEFDLLVKGRRTPNPLALFVLSRVAHRFDFLADARILSITRIRAHRQSDSENIASVLFAAPADVRVTTRTLLGVRDGPSFQWSNNHGVIGLGLYRNNASVYDFYWVPGCAWAWINNTWRRSGDLNRFAQAHALIQSGLSRRIRVRLFAVSQRGHPDHCLLVPSCGTDALSPILSHNYFAGISSAAAAAGTAMTSL